MPVPRQPEGGATPGLERLEERHGNLLGLEHNSGWYRGAQASFSGGFRNQSGLIVDWCSKVYHIAISFDIGIYTYLGVAGSLCPIASRVARSLRPRLTATRNFDYLVSRVGISRHALPPWKRQFAGIESGGTVAAFDCGAVTQVLWGAAVSWPVQPVVCRCTTTSAESSPVIGAEIILKSGFHKS